MPLDRLEPTRRSAWTASIVARLSRPLIPPPVPDRWDGGTRRSVSPCRKPMCVPGQFRKTFAEEVGREEGRGSDVPLSRVSSPLTVRVTLVGRHLSPSMPAAAPRGRSGAKRMVSSCDHLGALVVDRATKRPRTGRASGPRRPRPPAARKGLLRRVGLPVRAASASVAANGVSATARQRPTPAAAIRPIVSPRPDEPHRPPAVARRSPARRSSFRITGHRRRGRGPRLGIRISVRTSVRLDRGLERVPGRTRRGP